MVFLTLGLVQLTALEHAKLMTEYAAYQAARAGIVWNGSSERMHDAARVALLPTLGRTDSLPAFARTWAGALADDAALARLPWRAGEEASSFHGTSLLGRVRVDTLNPAAFGALEGVWQLRGGAGWKELDFDGPAGLPELPDLERHVAAGSAPGSPDDSERLYRKATVLSIRVRAWYELRIPFASWIVFVAWFAANADVALHGAIDRPALARQNALGRSGDLSGLASQGRGLFHQKGFPTATPEDMAVLWALATGQAPAAAGHERRRFFIPLSATYSMRMQSAFHRKWVMHPDPSWSL